MKEPASPGLVGEPVLLDLTHAQIFGIRTALEHMSGLTEQVRRGGARPYPEMTYQLAYWVTRSALAIELYAQAYSDTLAGQLERMEAGVRTRGIPDEQLQATLNAEAAILQAALMNAVVTRVALWPIAEADVDHPTNNYPPFVLRGLWPLFESEKYRTPIPALKDAA